MTGTARFCAALTPSSPGPAVPGIDRTALRLAMLEDVCDMLAALPLVRPALVGCPADGPAGAERLVAPGTPVLDAPDGSTAEVADAAFDGLVG
ncbi:MAG: hypothetical protein GEV09_26960, partial [Pseudonocardiaceae bacterium]|nr:hypothetical protein [Pseudonocardiaceae bacterium]